MYVENIKSTEGQFLWAKITFRSNWGFDTTEERLISLSNGRVIVHKFTGEDGNIGLGPQTCGEHGEWTFETYDEVQVTIEEVIADLGKLLDQTAEVVFNQGPRVAVFEKGVLRQNYERYCPAGKRGMKHLSHHAKIELPDGSKIDTELHYRYPS